MSYSPLNYPAQLIPAAKRKQISDERFAELLKSATASLLSDVTRVIETASGMGFSDAKVMVADLPQFTAAWDQVRDALYELGYTTSPSLTRVNGNYVAYIYWD